MLKQLFNFILRYEKYIRVASLIVVITAASDSFVLSTKKDPDLLRVFNKNLEIITNYCDKTSYYLPKVFSIKFDKIRESEVVAYCSIKPNGFKLVFEESFWNSLDNVAKTQLMFHEMAHCMFKEEHNPDPSHFMYASMNSIDPLTLSIQLHDYLSRRCKRNP